MVTDKILPFLKAMPVVAFLYGTIQTVAGLIEFSATLDTLRIASDGGAHFRILKTVRFLQCFDDLVFYWALAAIIYFCIRRDDRLTARS